MASSASRKRLIWLDGQLSAVEAEWDQLNTSVLNLGRKADIYASRMSAAVGKLDEASKLELTERILLHQAEYWFAEEIFMELSHHASVFERRLHAATIVLESVRMERTRLCQQIEEEMEAGHLTDGVYLGEPYHSHLYLDSRFSIRLSCLQYTLQLPLPAHSRLH